MTPLRRLVQVGRDRVQIGAWKSSGTVANLVPFPAGERLSEAALERALADARLAGFDEAYTAAMSPPQTEPFLHMGFELREELHLLRRPLRDEPAVPREFTRRGHRLDWDDVLALDQLAFADDFWRFDRTSLADAMRATPRHRFQVVRSSPVLGYHVTGLAGANAYLQRVAVHPDAHGQGWGSKLVRHSLYWACRHGATTAHVNTQIGNTAAVALYERCGFSPASHRLHVLYRSLRDVAVD